MKTTIIIPTFNEAENLPKMVSALFSLSVPDLSLLVVDDNSPDGTGQMAEEFKRAYPGKVDVLHRAGKMGLGTAYLEGFKKAMADGAEAMLQMDCDFSHPPEKIPEMMPEPAGVGWRNRFALYRRGQCGQRLASLAQGIICLGQFLCAYHPGFKEQGCDRGVQVVEARNTAGNAAKPYPFERVCVPGGIMLCGHPPGAAFYGSADIFCRPPLG